MPLTLYYHPLSSFCHKVLIALYEHGIEFEKRIIDLSSATDRAELEALWPIAPQPRPCSMPAPWCPSQTTARTWPVTLSV
jgi:hypothetical protein